jgi:phage tail protein X
MMPTSRHRGRPGSLSVQRDRLRVAQLAARLIVEHGLADWTLAKRKAARQLMLPDTTAMPSNAEIEVALAEHHALFGGDAHEASLRAMRAQALRWMERLAAYEPLLIGGVAAGWATGHSDIRLELVADDPKAVEIELASHNVVYAALPPRDGDAATHLMIESSASRSAGKRARDDSPRRSSRRRSGATARARATSRASTSKRCRR